MFTCGRIIMVQSVEERKEYQKEYRSRPQVKLMEKERRQTPEYKIKAKERERTPEYKAKARLTAKLYNARLENITRAKNRNYVNRLKILQHYSRDISESDIPCCSCCGLNSHIDFLDIDHITGKKEMESEPELVNLGYSSKLDGTVLNLWIIKNNFPKGFQILCKNCNQAKGMNKNNNECPMKNKPH